MKKIMLLLVACGSTAGLSATDEFFKFDDKVYSAADTYSEKVVRGKVNRDSFDQGLQKPRVNSANLVDNEVAQRMCELMKDSKNFKSLYGNGCEKCYCGRDAVLFCNCVSVRPGPVVKDEKVTSMIDFKDPKNHPVIVVTEQGEMELVSLYKFEKNKAYQEMYVQPYQDGTEKIYR